MYRFLVVLVVACGSKNPADVPVDHELHDLSSTTEDTRYLRYGGKQVEVADLPIVADRLGLPVRGTADILIDLAVPKTRGRFDYARTTGRFEITCTRCQIGDDSAKLALPDELAAAFVSDGIAFGHLTIDRLIVTGTVEAGQVRIVSWELRSPDVEVDLMFSMALASRFADSAVAGCVRFKPKPALRERDPRMFDLISLTGAARDADGVDHVSIEGTVDDTRNMAKLCGGVRH